MPNGPYKPKSFKPPGGSPTAATQPLNWQDPTLTQPESAQVTTPSRSWSDGDLSVQHPERQATVYGESSQAQISTEDLAPDYESQQRQAYYSEITQPHAELQPQRHALALEMAARHPELKAGEEPIIEQLSLSEISLPHDDELDRIIYGQYEQMPPDVAKQMFENEMYAKGLKWGLVKDPLKMEAEAGLLETAFGGMAWNGVEETARKQSRYYEDYPELYYAAMEIEAGRGVNLDPQLLGAWTKATGRDADGQMLSLEEVLKRKAASGLMSTYRGLEGIGLFAVEMIMFQVQDKGQRLWHLLKQLPARGFSGEPLEDIEPDVWLLHGKNKAGTFERGEAIQQWMSENPQYFATAKQDWTLFGLFADAVESAPYMMAVAGASAIGGPGLGYVVAMGLGTDQVYWNLRDSGASQADAAAMAMLLGPVHGAVEMLQWKGISKGLPGIARLFNANRFAYIVKRRTGNAVLRAVGEVMRKGVIISSSAGQEILRMWLTEGFEEAIQQGIEDGSIHIAMPGSATARQLTVSKMASNMLEAMVRGGGVAMLLGGGSTAIQLSGGIVTAKGKEAAKQRMAADQISARIRGQVAHLIDHGVPVRDAVRQAMAAASISPARKLPWTLARRLPRDIRREAKAERLSIEETRRQVAQQMGSDEKIVSEEVVKDTALTQEQAAEAARRTVTDDVLQDRDTQEGDVIRRLGNDGKLYDIMLGRDAEGNVIVEAVMEAIETTELGLVPAAQVGDEVFTGRTGAEAARRAMEATGVKSDEVQLGRLTNRRRFITIAEAKEIEAKRLEPTGMTGLETIEIMRKHGRIEQSTYNSLKYLLELDPEMNVDTVIRITDQLRTALPEMYEAEGIAADAGAGQIRGLTFQGRINGILRTAIDLYGGATAYTVMEEHYHRFWGFLSSEEKALFTAYHKGSGDTRSVQEHFGQEGRGWFFREHLPGIKGGVERIFAKAKVLFQRIMKAVASVAGARIPTEITDMYREVVTPGAAQARRARMGPVQPAAQAAAVEGQSVQAQVIPKSEANQPGVWWHGTPSGNLRGGTTGLHVGTRKAAEEALHARIGFPVEGDWDGTREYGKTLLAGQKTLRARGPHLNTGYNVDSPQEDHYPTGTAKYSDQSPIPMTAKPDIIPLKITGDMTNQPISPKEDFRANAIMRRQLTKGQARRGYYYLNVAEDEGQVSAVLPSEKHVERVEAEPPAAAVEEEGVIKGDFQKADKDKAMRLTQGLFAIKYELKRQMAQTGIKSLASARLSKDPWLQKYLARMAELRQEIEALPKDLFKDVIDEAITAAGKETEPERQAAERRANLKLLPEEEDPGSTQASIEVPHRTDTAAFKKFVAGLSKNARKDHDLFRKLLDIGQQYKIDADATQNGAARYMMASEWNEQIKAEPRFAQMARQLAAALPGPLRKQMRMNSSGRIDPTDFEREFHTYKSITQRVLDALPLQAVKATLTAPSGKEVDLGHEGREIMVPGGYEYRQALMEEYRRLWQANQLAKRSIAGLGKDNWGALGFLARNEKTVISGDVVTICPNMFYNKGCFYCYRRAAMELDINNRLSADNVWYTGEILRVKQADIDELNKIGGLRFQSFGDFMEKDRHQIAQMLIDADLVGLRVKIITKFPAALHFIAHLKKQGIGRGLYANISTDYVLEKAGPIGDSAEWQALNAGRPWIKLAPKYQKFGKPAEGVYWKRALSVSEGDALHKQYPWVLTRVVALNIEEFVAGLKDPRVHNVTGYHGRKNEFERVSTLTGTVVTQMEPLGDFGMPQFKADGSLVPYQRAKTGQIARGPSGKPKNLSAISQKLAEAIMAENLQQEYAVKACCIHGRCSGCTSKCGLFAAFDPAQIYLDDASTQFDTPPRRTVTTFQLEPSPRPPLESIEEFEAPMASVEPAYYFKLDKELKNLDARIHSADFGRWLKKRGVKEAEIEWLGMQDLIDSDRMLDRNEILHQLELNRYSIGTKERGGQAQRRTMIRQGDAGFDVNFADDLKEQIQAWHNRVADRNTRLIRQEIDKVHSYLEVGDDFVIAVFSHRDESAQVGSPWMWQARRINLSDPDYAEDLYQGAVTLESALDAARGAISEDREDIEGVKWGQYVEPGGENYREVLMRIEHEQDPEVANWTTAEVAYNNARADLSEHDKMMVSEYGENWKPEDALPEHLREYEQLADRVRITQRAMERTNYSFEGPHWDETEVAGHLRVNDRQLAKKRMLFAEELQSDWAQQIRDYGFKGPTEEVAYQAVDKRIQELHDEYAAIIEGLPADSLSFYDPHRTGGPAPWVVHTASLSILNSPGQRHFVTKEEAQRYARRNNPNGELGDIEIFRKLDRMGIESNRLEQERQAMTRRPFAMPWGKGSDAANLMAKQLLIMAAREGYEVAGWTSGDIQFKRWGSEQIVWQKRRARRGEAGTPTWLVGTNSQVGGFAGGIDLEAEGTRRGLTAQNSNFVTSKEQLREAIEPLVNNRDFGPAQYEDHIQKMTDRTWDRMQEEPRGQYLPRYEGMKFFYDNLLPKLVDKIMKRYGVKAQQGNIQAEHQWRVTENKYAATTRGVKPWMVMKQLGTMGFSFVEDYATKAEAEKAMAELVAKETPAIHTIEIPDAFREAVSEEGLPMANVEIPPGRRALPEPGPKWGPMAPRAATERKDYLRLTQKLAAEEIGAGPAMAEMAAAAVRKARQEILMDVREQKGELADMKKVIEQFANQHLPLQLRGKVVNRVAAAKTWYDVEKAIRFIQALEERAAHNDAKARLRKIYSRMKDRYGKGFGRMSKILGDAARDAVADLDPKMRGSRPKLEKLAAYLKNREESQSDMPDHVLEKLAQLSQKSLDQLTTDDLHLRADMLEHALHLQQLKKKLTKRQKGRSVNEFIDEALDDMGRIPGKPYEPDISTGMGRRPAGLARKFFGVEHANAHRLWEMAGGEAGRLTQIREWFEDSMRMHSDLKHQAGLVLREGLRAAGITEINFDDLKSMSRAMWGDVAAQNKAIARGKLTIRQIKLPNGQTVGLTPMEIVDIIMHWRSERNHRQLLKSPIGPRHTPTFWLAMEEADYEAILDAATDQEARIATAIRHTLDTVVPALNRAWEMTRGFPIAREIDYWNLPRNLRGMPTGESGEILGALHEQTLQGSGIYQEARENKVPIFWDDALSKLSFLINLEAATAAYAPAIRDAKIILGVPRLKTFIENKYGAHVLGALNDWVRRIDTRSGRPEPLSQGIRKLRSNITKSALLLRPGDIGLRQFVSALYLFNDAQFDASDLAAAAAAVAHTGAMIDEMTTNSPILRDRALGSPMQILTPGETGDTVWRWVTGQTPPGETLNIFGKHVPLDMGIKAVDLAAISVAWAAFKNRNTRAMVGASEAEILAQTAKDTENYVWTTQPTFDIVHRPAFATRTEGLGQLFTAFTSQTSQIYNILWAAGSRYSRSNKDIHATSRLIITLGVVGAAAMAINALRRLGSWAYGGFQPDDEEEAKLARALEVVEEMTGYVYVVGPTIGEIMAAIRKGSSSRLRQKDIWAGWVQDMANLGVSTRDIVEHGVTRERYKAGPYKGELRVGRDAWRASTNLARAIGALTGWPVSGPVRTIKGAVQALRGEPRKLKAYVTRGAIRKLSETDPPSEEDRRRAMRVLRNRGIDTPIAAQMYLRAHASEFRLRADSTALKAREDRIFLRWK